MLEARYWSKFALVVLAGTVACKSSSREQASSDGDSAQQQQASEAEIQRARAMTKAFAAELQSTLLAAIEVGGPAHAIGVCKHDAPKIAAAQAADGWTLSRTALRVRNPANAATAWQRAVLENWQEQLAAGQVDDPASLEWSEVLVDPGGKQLRYMRGIPLGGLCLTCHGPVEQLSPEVQAALAEQYPDDQATGFAVGDLRGAFVVTGSL